MIDTITLSWSSLAAIGGIVAAAMAAVMAYVHLVIEVKLARRDREWRAWAEERFDTLDTHVQSPAIADRAQVVLFELHNGIKKFLSDLERRLPPKS